MYLLLFLVLWVNVWGAEDVSNLLQPIIKQYDVPGMVAAVIENDKVTATGAAGVRERGRSEKVTIKDQFHLGSDTKAMTAAVLTYLVEKGQIKWDTKVSDVFPKLKIDPSYKNLTLEELLEHRGGVPANLNYDQIQKLAGNDLVRARQIAMERTLEKPVAQPPGTFLYSNLGYAIAGHMGEAVSGKSWDILMEDLIFKPLGMSSAGFGPPDNRFHSQPVGHTEDGKPVQGYGDNPLMMGPAGTVHASIQDWAKFIILQLKETDRFKKMQTPVKDEKASYGMGWGIKEAKWAKGPVLTHTGSNTYWVAIAWLAPKRHLAILVACNQGGKNGNAACQAAKKALLKYIKKENHS